MATSLGRLRTAFRGISQKNYLKARNYSEQVVPKDLELAIAAHPGYGPGIRNDVRFWKTWGTYWGGLPFCFLFTFLTAFVWHEHLERAEFIPYDHLRRRPGKKLPFGDGNHNLLHNHKWVPLPDGYEFTEEEVGLKNPH